MPNAGYKTLQVTYSRDYRGEIYTESYTRTLDPGETEQDIINALYSDPNVFDVMVKDITFWKGAH